MSMFRARQAASGYLRREVLMTEQTATQVKILAEAHQVSATDVASALLEYGLAQYDAQQTQAAEAVAEAAVSGALRGLSVAALPKGALGYAANACALSAASLTTAPASFSAVIGNAAPAISDNATTQNDNPIMRFFQRRKETKHE